MAEAAAAPTETPKEEKKEEATAAAADKPDAYQMARTLWGELKPGDGRRKVVAEAFAF